MFTLITLFLLLSICLVWAVKSRKQLPKFLSFIFLVWFSLETACYIYFLVLIYQGNSFFLIGNQTLLDAITKARLVYSVYYAQGKKTFIYRIDPDLGYTIGKFKDVGSLRSNQDGIRASREYNLIPNAHTLRVAAFGDSYVFCDGERNPDTWPAQLEKLAPNIEVLNFGVSGYGLGQSYLRYLKDGLRFQPDIVFFNYVEYGGRDGLNPLVIVQRNLKASDFYRARFSVTENGQLVSESLTPFHLFDPEFREREVYSHLGLHWNSPLLKWKIFSISNIGLLIKTEFLKYLATAQAPKDFLYSEEINFQILHNLIATARRSGTSVIFFAPHDFNELPERIQKLLAESRDFVVYLNSDKILQKKFESHNFKREELFNVSSHFNARGNAFYAEALMDILKEGSWGSGSRTFRYEPSSNSFRNVKKV